MEKVLKEYELGDMIARYRVDEEGHVGLLLFPKSMPANEITPEYKKAKLDSFVQLKLSGDTYQGAYAPGNTLREGESVQRMKFSSQFLEEQGEDKCISTVLEDDRGYKVKHILSWQKDKPYVRLKNIFFNNSQEDACLEMLSSFSMDGLSPYLAGDCHNEMMVHRLKSRWSEEGKLESRSMEELQLETSWTMEAVRCERFGQVGSLPVNHYFPFLAMEDKSNHVFWGAQISHGASWQMEIYRIDENIAISGGLADREFGHWMKRVKPGESFSSPEAIVTVCQTNSIDEMCARLTCAGEEAANKAPEAEQTLPIVFNEYCTTWGCPSHENIVEILETVKDKGFTYFVIDCGWYKEEGVPWDISMGDYEVSKDLFPDGLDKTVKAIKDAGMKPGIWFEIENVGHASRAFHRTEHLLHLDGKVLTTTRRRFFDMTDPWVEEYLTERVIGTLKKYGFEYMKIDYNDTIGIGCDGCESIGEGLRQNIEASKSFIQKVKKEIPGIVLENCASGGHRLEPGFMGLTSMASFSDAHECREIPIIAANLHRAILPRQSQIWAVIRKSDSLKRIAYSITNTFLGRMCISGDVTELTTEQWNVIERGMQFYRSIAPVIKDGQSYRFGPEVVSTRHPEGWQCLVRIGKNGQAYLTIHVFGGELPDEIVAELPKGTPNKIKEIYSDTQENVRIENGILRYQPTEHDKALAVWLCGEE